ncbi:MAG: sulfur transferase domain-containing protein [Acidobacteriota bacterium]
MKRSFSLFLIILLASVATFSAVQTTATKPYVCPPCGCKQDDEVFEQPGNCPDCHMVLVEKTPEMDEVTSIRRFLRVDKDICTGGQPRLVQLAKLKAEGIKTIINLRPPDEHAGAKEEAKAKELGLRYFNIPVSFANPQDEQVEAFLKLTDDAANRPMFIHCAAAIRVGAFWMIRRVMRDGWTVEKAQEEAKKIGLTNQDWIDFAMDYLERHKK